MCFVFYSEAGAHQAARRFARKLQKMGFRVRFANYRVVNVLGTCFLPFAVKLSRFAEANRSSARLVLACRFGLLIKIFCVEERQRYYLISCRNEHKLKYCTIFTQATVAVYYTSMMYMYP